MGWPHCFKTHQARDAYGQHSSSTRQARQPEHAPAQQQQQPSSFAFHKPAAAYTRQEPNERDKQAAEALKKEGNSCFGKAKYGAAIEVL